MRKILWLVDPFENPASLEASAAWVRGVSKKLKAPVLPVHVLGGGALGFGAEMQAAWLMQLVIEAEDRLRESLKGMSIPHLLPPHVISEVYHSRAEAVAGLLEFAAENGAELMILSRTGSRPGRAAGRPDRADKGKMGGFAETLLLKSRIPVLVVPRKPGVRARQRLPRSILVAMDLGNGRDEIAREVFRESLHWARRLGASLSLFHALPFASAAAYGPGAFDLGATAAASVFWSEEASNLRRKQLERFKAMAEKKGVRCTIELETRAIRPADAILRAARRQQSEWIAMASHSGRWSALVLGSVTRMVARESDCPVWIIHLPRHAEGAAKAA